MASNKTSLKVIHQVLGDSGLGQDGLCGQEEEWNQRYYVIVMYAPAHNEL